MNIFNFLGANALMIGFFVFDIILILCAIGISIWFYVKYLKQNKNKIQQEQNKNIEKIDDDTYIIETNEDFDEEQTDAVQEQKTNRVEHFASQIAEINEPSTEELKAKTVVKNKEVEMPKKKTVKKEEIENFVVVDGVKKNKTNAEKTKSVNHGANAFKNSTNFLDNIKNEQVQTDKNKK